MSRGFHVVVGNPPWVSYVGRAAHPLDPRERRFLSEVYRSFAGYKNLQGVFIERGAYLLRDKGRLGVIVPSSMSELDGYAPTRDAHDRFCACDPDLADLGTDEFAGVFQPCMALVSTRRPEGNHLAKGARWPVERRDLDVASRALMERLAALPPLPSALFGERGLQTSGGDVARLALSADPQHGVALRAGGDIEPFLRATPSYYADATEFGTRLRTPLDWQRVRILIRQTARVPMAALSDGGAFRNSILAGFESDAYPAAFLVAYLNGSAVRWLHYVRHRDARQGLPQLKISHLRAIPAPVFRELVSPLARLGATLSDANAGISPVDQAAIDDGVADALGLSRGEREVVAAWKPRFHPPARATAKAIDTSYRPCSSS